MWKVAQTSWQLKLESKRRKIIVKSLKEDDLEFKKRSVSEMRKMAED